MAKRRRDEPGRLKLKLAALLLEKGVIVAPRDLWVQQGYYRQCDGARWGSNHGRFVGGKAPDGSEWTHEFQFSAWSTMTECVRYGITVDKQDRFGLWNWVSVEAKDPPNGRE